MLSYAYETCVHADGTVELSLPDLDGVCVLSYSEEAAVGHARHLLHSLLHKWMVAGLPVPKPSRGPKTIDVPFDLALRLALHWHAETPVASGAEDAADELARVISFAEARRRLRPAAGLVARQAVVLNDGGAR